MTSKKPDSSDVNIDWELAKLRWKTRFRRISRWLKSPLQRLPRMRRRSVSRLASRRLLLVCLLGIVTVGQLGLAPVPGMPVDGDDVTNDPRDGFGFGSDSTTDATATQTDHAADSTAATSDTERPTADDVLNRSEIELAIHDEINDQREDHDLDPITFNPRLQTIARGHSEDMAENDYLSHTAPDGSDFEDRYQGQGFDCRVSTEGNAYVTGGENIAYTYAFTDVTGEDGITRNFDSEDELAGGIVNQWMDSPDHRENILRPYWKNEGIGVAIVEGGGQTKVYATQNFC